MGKIRVLFSFTTKDGDALLPELRERSRAARAKPGCLESDYYRGVHFPENIAQAELWESPEAFDRHWQEAGLKALPCEVRELSAPFQRGAADYPRRHGMNAAEFYRYEEFVKVGKCFVPKDTTKRSASIRWPSRSGVRIVTNLCFDTSIDADLVAYSLDTRSQHGCLEFDWLRSVEFPENMLHLELWAPPPSLYDAHYFLRTINDIWGGGVARPFRGEQTRRYGSSGFEFYQSCRYALSGQVWEPEEPVERLQTVQWN